MDDATLQAYKQRLISKREQLMQLEQVAEESSQVVELDQTRVGRLSRMDALQSQAMSRERARRRKLELQLISSALQRMDEGDYGYCVKCGEDIAEGRLQLDPAVLLCIHCAEKQSS